MRFRALIGAVVTAIAVGTFAGGGVAFADTGTAYVNNGSAKCFGALSPGIGVEQQTCTYADNQRWELLGATANGNPFQMRNVLTHLCLDISSFNNAAPVVQVDCGGQPIGSYWKYVPAGTREFPRVNLFMLKSPFANFCLDLENGDRQDGVSMQVWRCNSRTNNQIWYPSFNI